MGVWVREKPDSGAVRAQENGQVRSPRHGKEEIWDIKIRKKKKLEALRGVGG